MKTFPRGVIRPEPSGQRKCDPISLVRISGVNSNLYVIRSIYSKLQKITRMTHAMSPSLTPHGSMICFLKNSPNGRPETALTTKPAMSSPALRSLQSARGDRIDIKDPTEYSHLVPGCAFKGPIASSCTVNCVCSLYKPKDPSSPYRRKEWDQDQQGWWREEWLISQGKGRTSPLSGLGVDAG